VDNFCPADKSFEQPEKYIRQYFSKNYEISKIYYDNVNYVNIKIMKLDATTVGERVINLFHHMNNMTNTN